MMILVSVAVQVCSDASEYTHCSVSIDNKQTAALLLHSQCDYYENTEQKMTQNLTFTVKEINADAVVLDLSGKISTSMSKDSSGIKMDISGDEKGTMQMDRTTGMIKQGAIDMDMKMSAMGKPMTMKVKTIIEGKQ